MGPLDPLPPMVTAGGYAPPTAPMDQNAQLADLLRRKQAAQKQMELSAGNTNLWQNTIGQPQFTQTVRGGGNAPDQVVVNWGDILGKGASNYMASKERKQALSSKQEVNDINNQFMESTLQNDPQSQKLYMAVQAGLPGADKALSEHLAPKKQSLAILTQFISGGGDPEMAAQLAGSLGVDPEVAFKAAQYQVKRAEDKQNATFDQQVVLQDMKNKDRLASQQGKVGPTGYTQEELQNMPIEQRLAAVRAAGGRESAESKARGKLKVEAEQDLPKTDYALQRLNDVVKLASQATYYPGTLGLADNRIDRTGKNAMIRQAMKQLTLDANGGKLGAGFSNADRDFVEGAQAMLDSGNRDTVVAQFNNLIANLINHRQLMSKAAGVEAPKDTMTGPQSPLDYTAVKKLRPQAADTFEEDAKGLNFGE